MYSITSAGLFSCGSYISVRLTKQKADQLELLQIFRMRRSILQCLQSLCGTSVKLRRTDRCDRKEWGASSKTLIGSDLAPKGRSGHHRIVSTITEPPPPQTRWVFHQISFLEHASCFSFWLLINPWKHANQFRLWLCKTSTEAQTTTLSLWRRSDFLRLPVSAKTKLILCSILIDYDIFSGFLSVSLSVSISIT